MQPIWNCYQTIETFDEKKKFVQLKYTFSMGNIFSSSNVNFAVVFMCKFNGFYQNLKWIQLSNFLCNGTTMQ